MVGVLGLTLVAAWGEPPKAEAATTETVTVTSDDAATNGPLRKKRIVIRELANEAERNAAGRKEVAWLGVGVEEASEALASQLSLQPGAGLVITYVGPDSPAAKAGLEKNDLLVEFDGQLLVHPAQLRKLVRMHKEGENLNLVFYHAGKQQTKSVTLGKTVAGFSLLQGERAWPEALHDLQLQLEDLRASGAARSQLSNLHENIGRVRIQNETLKRELERSLKSAHEAYRDALRHYTNAPRALGSAAITLDELDRHGIELDHDATVTIKNAGASANTIVRTDPTGTYVLVADPKRRLTAHGPDGKLLFEGEIETPEQQSTVPPEVWKKVKSMLETPGAPNPSPTEDEPTPPADTSALVLGHIAG